MAEKKNIKHKKCPGEINRKEEETRQADPSKDRQSLENAWKDAKRSTEGSKM
jgi:hypothetical protein